jgi:hypothetical protein
MAFFRQSRESLKSYILDNLLKKLERFIEIGQYSGIADYVINQPSSLLSVSTNRTFREVCLKM